MKTPYFVLNEIELLSNINQFKEALKLHWPNSQIAYSIKTNSLPWLLKYMHQQEIFAEVVSDHEYQLAILARFYAKSDCV